MNPTNKLRFVKRLQVTSRQNGLQKETIHVLQQWWITSNEPYEEWVLKQPGEWRDVPLENEE